MSRNLHRFYYKEYFKGVNWQDEKKAKTQIKQNNAVLTAPNLWSKMPPSDDNPHPYDDKCSITLEVLYPGLVTGIGINHEATIEGEFKLGLHFDWTYGMPVVYGSSVKGVLRSALIAKVEKGKIKEYDGYFLKELTGREWTQEEIRTLFNAIFDGKNAKGENLSIYDRDIFFDAVITAPDSKKRILCSDSITPHGGETHDNPLKNPTPLGFIKIAPGCTMEFRFCLKENCDLLSASKKKELFYKILTTVGIGAKTNVGYGQLKA